jgi:hypothetical protein
MRSVSVEEAIALISNGARVMVGTGASAEGRSGRGLHRQAAMTMIADAFLHHRRLAQAGRKKRINADLRLSQACRRYPKPSSILFFDRYHNNAHAAENESVKTRSTSICQGWLASPVDQVQLSADHRAADAPHRVFESNQPTFVKLRYNSRLRGRQFSRNRFNELTLIALQPN